MCDYNVYPKPKIQFTLLITWATIMVIIPFTLEGPWSIQSLLAHNSSNVTGSSLKLSYIEYEVYVGVPYTITIIPILFGGVLIDVLGIPSCTIISCCIALFGSAIQAISIDFSTVHLLTVVILVVGQCVYFTSFISLMVMKNYVASVYFDISWRSITAGVLEVASVAGSGFIYAISPRIALPYGVAATYWFYSGCVLLPVASAVLLFVISRTSDSFRKSDAAHRDLSLALSLDGVSPVGVLRSYETGYWLLLISISSMRIVSNILDINAIDIQRVMFGTPLVEAADNMSLLQFTDIMAILLIGGLAGLIHQNILFGLMSCCAGLCAVLILMLRFASPTVAYILLGIFYRTTHVCLYPHVRNYVPFKFLGIALSMAIAVSNVMTGVFAMIIGSVMTKGNGEGSKNRWFNCLGFTILLCMIPFVCLSILQVIECKKSNESDDSEDQESKLSRLFHRNTTSDEGSKVFYSIKFNMSI